ncbi:hypothetical protein IWZ03DRAFT_247097 [Phyllosticta citriasiana]|uniref:Uncharacterized protein n=1 Tax=Phyllosticta citriasiana TaxID=595635 RepID=A0ABR1KG32_9PEZI
MGGFSMRWRRRCSSSIEWRSFVTSFLAPYFLVALCPGDTCHTNTHPPPPPPPTHTCFSILSPFPFPFPSLSPHHHHHHHQIGIPARASRQAGGQANRWHIAHTRYRTRGRGTSFSYYIRFLGFLWAGDGGAFAIEEGTRFKVHRDE